MSAICDSRNRWTHDDKGYDPTTTLELIAETMGYLEKKKKKNQKEVAHSATCKWQAPEHGLITWSYQTQLTWSNQRGEGCCWKWWSGKRFSGF
jgi:hypothetical protein